MGHAVLVIDDDRDDQVALRATLESQGHEVSSAQDCAEALRLLLRRDFDLLVLDMSLPGASGLETAGLIRDSPRFHETPIVFLSGYDEEYVRGMPGWPSEPVAYLRKPASAESLAATVTTMLGA